MSGQDQTLRDTIAQALTNQVGYVDPYNATDAVLALVADPELRMLWLDALGLEVTEHALVDYGDGDYLLTEISDAPPPLSLVLVVRPRAEETLGVVGDEHDV